MARPIRAEHANAVYHVTTQGNERKAIYPDDTDHEVFYIHLNPDRPADKGQVIPSETWLAGPPDPAAMSRFAFVESQELTRESAKRTEQASTLESQTREFYKVCGFPLLRGIP